MATKPKPRERPLNLSTITTESVTVPNREKAALSPSWVVSKERFPMYNFIEVFGNRPPSAQLFPEIGFQITTEVKLP
jgi:hypothetical protein